MVYFSRFSQIRDLSSSIIEDHDFNILWLEVLYSVQHVFQNASPDARQYNAEARMWTELFGRTRGPFPGINPHPRSLPMVEAYQLPQQQQRHDVRHTWVCPLGCGEASEHSHISGDLTPSRHGYARGENGGRGGRNFNNLRSHGRGRGSVRFNNPQSNNISSQGEQARGRRNRDRQHNNIRSQGEQARGLTPHQDNVASFSNVLDADDIASRVPLPFAAIDELDTESDLASRVPLPFAAIDELDTESDLASRVPLPFAAIDELDKENSPVSRVVSQFGG
ncbi:hypothetical protein BELL_0164g00050 [Botrytis elliptica]|uniref:Uncharacterized protein n=1 Tax=Botrytis elliptica TaxID=278938 RepID=A0A4Z1JS19_9HELO|nr:hypothetical protein EAE99_009464 [Botrytis elliptica]TGO76276.1 hypothetical protein BELL_0164g00050 [Botrytis elliptica]